MRSHFGLSDGAGPESTLKATAGNKEICSGVLHGAIAVNIFVSVIDSPTESLPFV